MITAAKTLDLDGIAHDARNGYVADSITTLHLVQRIRELEVELAITRDQPLIGTPHTVSKECPSYYDGCNCTVDALVHNIKRADDAVDALVHSIKRADDAETKVRELEARLGDRISGDDAKSLIASLETGASPHEMKRRVAKSRDRLRWSMSYPKFIDALKDMPKSNVEELRALIEEDDSSGDT